ncbi:hypothetical protein [Paraburkholderia panacisoli]|uniref:hypothetical protein n=1 Tax=Paraburkholderia panacisoli TaxID=2603818 RepID=UPI001FE258CD|nr:hypothetical protein [Paraburkholderia panacisoli]
MQTRQLRLQRFAYLVGKPGRRLDNDIDNQLASAGCQLELLFLQFLDRVFDALTRVLANMFPPVQHPVDRG